MNARFNVYRNSYRVGGHPCESCKKINCCNSFEAAWGLMTAYLDEMRGSSVGTTWNSREMQQMYDDAARHGGFGAIVTQPDGKVGCACIADEIEDEF